MRTPGMLTLLVVGLVSGLVTAISPCVLPVLPVVLTTSAQQGTPSARRAVVVVGGLVTSFAVFTLLGGALLSLLHLPQDLLRWIGIAILAVVGLGLVWPRVGHLLEAPFVRTRMPRLDRDGNGFVLGLGLGLVFVPCAGPILASITVLAATAQIGWGLVLLTLAFSVGIAIPLLGFALAGNQILARVKAVRERTQLMRGLAGGVMIATALVIAFNLAEPLQRLTPTWLAGVSDRIQDDDAVRAELDALGGRPVAETRPGSFTFDECAADSSVLADCGTAPELTGITSWLNSEPLTLESLKGKVVLLDFWTYSCINCQRTLPHLEALDARYAADGLVVLGVHSPEFAFEKVEDNVKANAARLGVEYPIALDNDFRTWRAWSQRFWPAHYLIDQTGTVRQVHYGEGAYEETETAVRTLLGLDAMAPAAAGPSSQSSGGSGAGGGERSPETYLGSARLGAHTNEQITAGAQASYTLSAQPPRDEVSFGGSWSIDPEYAEAGPGAVLTYSFHASQVFLVLAGEGTATVTLAGDPGRNREVTVSGAPSLYTLVDGPESSDVLRLELSPGLQAYAFTFG